ncbi:hypothetical protein V2J09_012070 [Rumex salicifolius]
MEMSWPEPIVRVQALSESGLQTIPSRYIKSETDRPDIHDDEISIPVIDLSAPDSDTTLEKIHMACAEWGFFQVVNHGIRPDLMGRARETWRQFFYLPMDVKQGYANSPDTYEGYGSRLGVEKGAILDWSDYYFLQCVKDNPKLPMQPPLLREVMEDYLEEVIKLSRRVMKIMSKSLGLKEDALNEAFGGDVTGSSLRANIYPKCPQPDLTLGLSSHSDPGGITVLLPDPDVTGLQVRKDGKWVTVKSAPNAFIVNIGDQVQVVSNGIFKSIEHRVMVNPNKERLSLALFYNPRADIIMKPADELVTSDRPALYNPMTFNEYRLYIRTKGPQGKAQVESLKKE